MSGHVELEFHRLRRRSFPIPDRWGTARPDIAWLHTQLQSFVDRYSAAGLADPLLGFGDPGFPATQDDVVGRIRDLIDAGWIEVTTRSLAADASFQTPLPAEEAVALQELVAPAEPRPAPSEPPRQRDAPAPTATSAAQVATLLTAAELGTPFCQVCTLPPEPKAEEPEADPALAAQVATLVLAAESGAPFCAVCT